MKKITSEWNGFKSEIFEFNGQKAAVIFPENPLKEKKWLFKTEYLDAFPSFELEMLKMGYFVANIENETRWGAEKDMRRQIEFAQFLQKEYGFNEKCIPVGMSCGVITDADDILLPLYLKRTKNIEGWLASRAIDSHRTNSRLLKRALRLRTTDDMQTALAVNAATVTDRYWFRPEGSAAVYEDIRFKENYFSELALRGDPDSFSNRPSRTPELTNTGSFEKCWKLINGEWWMYKSGNEKEYFSELFICRLGEKLGLPMAHYELDGEYIRSKDFTNGADVNFEPMRSLADDDEDYENCFNILNEISPDIAVQYLLLLWMDTVCYNMDRHTENFGLLRDVKTGRIISLAPNYDNNIALIAKGYPTDVRREHDGLIGFLKTFIQSSEEAHEMYRQMKPPEITERMIDECMDEIPIKADRDYIRSFVLNGQEKVREIICADIEPTEDNAIGIML